MKRIDLIKHLRKHNCYLIREGNNHSVFVNVKNNMVSTIPRHTEINTFLGKKICRDLGISEIKIK